MNDDKKSLGRVFFEGLVFGSGLVIAGGALKLLWQAVTRENNSTALDESDYESIEGED